MTETPREYKKRIDEQRKKRRKNRDKLIQQIENYELVDKDYKAKTKQEILSNFEKNEKAEKESEQYKVIVSELENIDTKYKELEGLKEKLKIKKQEISDTIDELNGQKMDGTDETTLKIQMNNIKKLKIKLEGMEKEVEDLEKEIENREQELKEIEETYGKRVETDISDSTYSNADENASKNNKGHSMTKTTKEKTLEEFKEKTLEKKGKLEQSRGEIIKLLDEGIGIDESLKEKIKGEITEVFDEYNDKQEGSLRMKSARYMEDRKGIFDELGYGNERETKSIGGKQLIKGKKLDGKRYIIWGGQKIIDNFDFIGDIFGIGGKPCFKVQKNGKWCTMRGKEQQGDWFDSISDLQEIGGKPCFIAKKDGKYCVMSGNEQYTNWFDIIKNFKGIGGKPCFDIRIDGKWCTMRGKEKTDNCERITYMGEKPVFKIGINGKSCIMRGNEKLLLSDKFRNKSNIRDRQGDWFDAVSRPIGIGGKPCFEAKKDGKLCIMWGKEQQGEWFDGILDLQEIGGKPCFEAKKDGKLCIMWGKDQIGDWFEDIDVLQGIGGKPCFIAKKDGKWRMMRGDEKQGDGFDAVSRPIGIGGKPCFEAKKDGKLCIMWRKEQQGEWFDGILDLQEIGGKPCFEAKKDGKYCVMRGNEQQGGLYNNCNDGAHKIRAFIDTHKSSDNNDENNNKVKRSDEEKSTTENQGPTLREKREKVILERYQKKLNRDELLGIISRYIKDKETGKELESGILRDFYDEYKKVTSIPEFQERDKEYRELKKTERQYDKKRAEMDAKKEKNIPEMTELDEKLCQIVNSAMKLEDGSRWKSRKLKKTMAEWENLKNRQNEILQEVRKLNIERKELYSQSKEKGIKYGKKNKRPIIKGKKLNEYTGIADKLKSETTLKGYKEIYQQIAQDKQKYMDDLIEQIRTTDFGIGEEKKQEVIEQLKISMSKEIDEYGQGDEITKLADETEKWLEENWGNAMRQIIELKGKIEKVESKIKEIESKGNGHNSKEIFQIKEKEFELRRQLLALKNEQESIKADLDEKSKSYDGTSIDWTKDLKIETFESWKEWVKTAEREEMKKKYNNERWMFKNEASESWRKDVESYPHGRLYSFDCVDDVAVECGDRVGLIALYDCSMDRDYTNSHSDPEYSAVLYFKVGDYVDYRKFVWRHATDADLDNKSLAYKMISDAKLDGDTLQVWLSKGKGEPSTKYEFKINGGN